MVKRYVTYRRVSTKAQGGSGLGLDAQDRDICIFLESYSEEPWEVAGEFIDVPNGKDSVRPELAKAIDLANREGAELLVAKLDRISRQAPFIATLIEDKRLKLRVASMPHACNFQLLVYAILSEQERDFISKRTKAALAEAKARGQILGGLRDATMRRNEVVKANAQARAAKVEGIIRPLREAGKTLQQIAEELNLAGVQTARGGAWHASQVKRTLDRLSMSQM
jgi:DNA invertase Pin-like site-specific DNA recombinase